MHDSTRRPLKADLSADLQFVLVEEKLLQVALHLHQAHLKTAVGEQVVAGLLAGSGWDAAAQHLGEGARPSLQAGHVGLDLAGGLRRKAL